MSNPKQKMLKIHELERQNMFMNEPRLRNVKNYFEVEKVHKYVMMSESNDFEEFDDENSDNEIE